MGEFPDFSQHGYRIIDELGCNLHSGRVTYLAIDLNAGINVVIKQFQFAISSKTTWSGYKAIEKEISILKDLEHPGIPKYLKSIQTSTGFCIVQEFKNAPTLSQNRTFSPEEIKQITLKLLNILVYIQNRTPSITHKDIKPENILVDAQLNVFLIDFGLAVIGNGKFGASTMYAGTIGFIPREQLLQGSVNKASDLYGLGATLICLLTGIKTGDLSTSLIDDDFQINFKDRVPGISFRFIDWLEKMVAPRSEDRYPDAKTALKALKPLYIVRVPEVQLNVSYLEFEPQKLGAGLTKNIEIKNSIPETILEGYWSVKAHSSDPPHTPDRHNWISFSPKKFRQNQIRCQVTVDTSQLQANRLYKREILLHTNAQTATYKLGIKVKTAPFPIKKNKQPYASLALLLIFLISGTWFGINDYHAAETWLTQEATTNGNVAVQQLKDELEKPLEELKSKFEQELDSLGNELRIAEGYENYDYEDNRSSGFGKWLSNTLDNLTSLLFGWNLSSLTPSKTVEKPPKTLEEQAHINTLYQKIKVKEAEIKREIAKKEAEVTRQFNEQEDEVRGNTEAQTREKFGEKVKVWTNIGAVFGTMFGILSGAVVGVLTGRMLLRKFDFTTKVLAILLIPIGFMIMMTVLISSDTEYLWGMAFQEVVYPSLVRAGLFTSLAMCGWGLLNLLIGKRSVLEEFRNPARLLLSLGLGLSAGLALTFSTFNPLLLITLTATGLPLAAMTFYPPLKRYQLINKYRKNEQHLIQP